MRIPSDAKEIIGKNEFCRNLHTTDIYEANIKKHKEIASMLEEIEQAKRNYEGMKDKLSKEVQISKYAEYLREAKITTPEKDADTSLLEKELSLKLGVKLTINDKNNKGNIKIEYRNIDQREKILNKLGRG